MKTPPKLSQLVTFTLLMLSYFTSTAIADIPACNLQDQAVLIKIRDHFGGPHGRLSDWDSDSDCCYYNFVWCSSSPGNEYGRVTAVGFSRSWGLTGTIPPDFGDLPYLESITISQEIGITGTIPSSFSKLTRLNYLDLGMNSLTGPIPAELFQLKTLTYFDLSGNKFSGVIPPSISSLTKLSLFNVSHNQLMGSLPPLSSKSLKSFDVSYNQLCGAIPSGLKGFSQASFANNKCLCGPPLSPCK